MQTLGRHGWCAVLAMSVAIGACNRDQSVPVAHSESATPVQATSQPTSVKGCLRAGEAADTYVLTADRAAAGPQVATYQLQPAAGVELAKLAEHVGKEVEVSGTIVAQQEVTTRSSPQPVEKATGTAGTPTVSTATKLELRRLNVQQIRHLGPDCPEEQDK